ncbi:hypothetical protein ZYGR_0AG04840 [Zygosaccharomyces rouxii]|uniref:SPT2 chromatin protein n=1 Tax=Zygosaccharomyces rouxii TaxID=4956 RepID=A0A1Q3AA84_ZYGRO|nr:hypothetical protein ZYGR_0AG04840 [Zygosaccharomyces rouxii]
MSFLSKISNLRKSIPVAPPKANPPSSQPETYQAPSLLPKSYTREEDPAVRRLKEKRQQELLKKGELSKKATASKRTSAPRRSAKKDSDDENKTVSRFKKKSSSSNNGLNRPTHISVAQKKKPEPIKKMSFDELMKQAENNAHSNGGGSASKSSSTTPVGTPSEPQSRPRPHINKPGFKNPDRRRRAGSQEIAKAAVKSQTTPIVKKPKPPKLTSHKNDFAKPNELIRRRLEAKKKASRVQETQQDEYESDMDDFIEDDEEEDRSAMERDPGYDRDEIWALFNRGKRRSDYAFDDEDEDDMEANEGEIIEEEERARKMARLEDKREEEWLRKHEMEKKRRKKARD